jgi:NNP family nitrate/nitrite transporter-like MFS transporter
MRVAGGSIADKFGGEKVSLLAMTAILIAVAALSFANSVPFSVAAVLLLATGMGIANAAIFKLVPVYVPEAVGGAAGWIGGLGAFGGFALPPVMGAIAGKYGEIGYARGFLVFFALAGLDLLIIYLLLNKRKKQLTAMAEIND